MAEDGFQNGLGVVDRHAHAQGEQEGEVGQFLPPGLGTHHDLGAHVKDADGHAGQEEQGDVHEPHDDRFIFRDALRADVQPSDRLDMAINGSLLANFINQIQLEVAECDLACTSFANAVKGFNKSVTVRDIVSTYVYPNTLVVREVSGKVLKQALEVCASYIDYTNGELSVSKRFLQPKVAHYNYDFFSNVEYTFDLTKPVGERVVNMIVKGQEVNPTDTFSLVMNNYRSSGVGGYEFFRDCPIIKEIQIEMTEIIIDYFKKHQHVTVDDRQFIHIIK